jgi:C1A family cysteine protease
LNASRPCNGLVAEVLADPLACGVSPHIAGYVGSILPACIQKTSPLRSQGQHNTCLPFAVADTIQDLELDLGNDCRPAEWNLYWHARRLENSLGFDNGCRFSSAIFALRELGAPLEEAMPYRDFGPDDPPPFEAQNLAWPKKEEWKMYPTSSLDIEIALLSGARIAAGIVIDDEFIDGETIKNEKPWMAAAQKAGAHAIRIIGYDVINGRRALYCKNTWGEEWGLHGFFWMDWSVLYSPRFMGAWQITRGK